MKAREHFATPISCSLFYFLPVSLFSVAMVAGVRDSHVKTKQIGLKYLVWSGVVYTAHVLNAPWTDYAHTHTLFSERAAGKVSEMCEQVTHLLELFCWGMENERDKLQKERQPSIEKRKLL